MARTLLSLYISAYMMRKSKFDLCKITVRIGSLGIHKVEYDVVD